MNCIDGNMQVHRFFYLHQRIAHIHRSVASAFRVVFVANTSENADASISAFSVCVRGTTTRVSRLQRIERTQTISTKLEIQFSTVN